MSEKEPRLTDDQLIDRLYREWENNDEGQISDRLARIIASQYHGGQASDLYSFVSTGAIGERIEAEISGCYAIARFVEEDQRAMDILEALMDYVGYHGERGPVEGWHDANRW